MIVEFAYQHISLGMPFDPIFSNWDTFLVFLWFSTMWWGTIAGLIGLGYWILHIGRDD